MTLITYTRCLYLSITIHIISFMFQVSIKNDLLLVDSSFTR